jgi:LPXTG-motif cell wall-anchored protein
MREWRVHMRGSRALRWLAVVAIVGGIGLSTTTAGAFTSLHPSQEQSGCGYGAQTGSCGTQVLGATEAQGATQGGTTATGALPRTGGSGDRMGMAIGVAFVLLGAGLFAGARRRSRAQ